MIGITYAGYRAQQMNVAINVKTAEKRLQFGVNKCKTMIVGKNYKQEMDNPMMVDKWKLEYLEESENNQAHKTIRQQAGLSCAKLSPA